MRLPICAALAIGLMACGKSSTNVDPVKPGDKSKNNKSNLGGDDGEEPETEASSGINPDDVLNDDASLIKAKYGITLRAAGIDACLGEVVIRVKAKADIEPKPGAGSAGLFSVEEGIVKCPGIGTFDLKEMLGAFQDQAPPPDMSKAVDVSDNVIGLRALQTGLYEPARPMLPSFLATAPDVLRTIAVKRSVTLTDTKTNESTTGEVEVKTISLAEYKPVKMQRTFPKVLHFDTTNSGFQGADKIAHFLFDSMQFHISLAPLAILRMQFQGRASDYTGRLDELTKNGSGASNPLGGLSNGSGNSGFDGVVDALGNVIKVQVELDLMQQQNLDDTNADPAEDDGPVIGLRD